MNPNRKVLRLLIFSQLFSFLFLVLLPSVIRLLPTRSGKMVYSVLALGAIGLGFFLRRCLDDLSGP